MGNLFAEENSGGSVAIEWSGGTINAGGIEQRIKGIVPPRLRSDYPTEVKSSQPHFRLESGKFLVFNAYYQLSVINSNGNSLKLHGLYPTTANSSYRIWGIMQNDNGVTLVVGGIIGNSNYPGGIYLLIDENGDEIQRGALDIGNKYHSSHYFKALNWSIFYDYSIDKFILMGSAASLSPAYCLTIDPVTGEHESGYDFLGNLGNLGLPFLSLSSSTHSANSPHTKRNIYIPGRPPLKNVGLESYHDFNYINNTTYGTNFLIDRDAITMTGVYGHPSYPYAGHDYFPALNNSIRTDKADFMRWLADIYLDNGGVLKND